MIWLIVACNFAPSNRVTPEGTPPPLPEAPAWATVRPLDGVQRLFGGPFRCRVPDGTVVDFHPNGMARGEPAFRGTWIHRDAELVVEARQEGVELVYSWPYVGYTHDGDWMLATPDGALACRPGHEATPGPAGSWLEVIDAGGSTEAAAKVLSTAEGVAFAVDGPVGEGRSGLWLRHRPSIDGRSVAQHVATGLGLPVAVEEVPDLAAPLQLVVGHQP
jgi:hypothetical protein